MKNLFKTIIAAGLAISLAGCGATSINRIGSGASLEAGGGTGVVVFSTQKDGTEGYRNRTTAMTARLYDPATGCTRDIPNEERDIMAIGNLDINQGMNYSSTERNWHVYELVPGDYVVTQITRFRNSYPQSTVENIQVVGAGPVFSVREDRVTYAGDFSVSSNHNRLFRFLGHSEEEAQAHLSTYSNLPQEIEVVPSRIVPLLCGIGPGAYPSIRRSPFPSNAPPKPKSDEVDGT